MDFLSPLAIAVSVCRSEGRRKLTDLTASADPAGRAVTGVAV